MRSIRCILDAMTARGRLDDWLRCPFRGSDWRRHTLGRRNPARPHRHPWAKLSSLLSAAAMLASPSRADASGVGDLGEGLHDVYFHGVVPAGIVLPEYSLRFGGDGAIHGLQWEVPFLVASGDLEAPVWGGGASLSWYPSVGDLMLRATARVMWPIRSAEESWRTEVPGVSLGIGGFRRDEGYGPRAELRVRYWCWAGLFASAAWEPTVGPSRSHGGEASAGLELPLPL